MALPNHNSTTTNFSPRPLTPSKPPPSPQPPPLPPPAVKAVCGNSSSLRTSIHLVSYAPANADFTGQLTRVLLAMQALHPGVDAERHLNAVREFLKADGDGDDEPRQRATPTSRTSAPSLTRSMPSVVLATGNPGFTQMPPPPPPPQTVTVFATVPPTMLPPVTVTVTETKTVTAFLTPPVVSVTETKTATAFVTPPVVSVPSAPSTTPISSSILATISSPLSNASGPPVMVTPAQDQDPAASSASSHAGTKSVAKNATAFIGVIGALAGLAVISIVGIVLWSRKRKQKTDREVKDIFPVEKRQPQQRGMPGFI